jgi:hypothetical protein
MSWTTLLFGEPVSPKPSASIRNKDEIADGIKRILRYPDPAYPNADFNEMLRDKAERTIELYGKEKRSIPGNMSAQTLVEKSIDAMAQKLADGRKLMDEQFTLADWSIMQNLDPEHVFRYVGFGCDAASKG